MVSGNETIGINGAKLPETPNFQNGTYRLSTDLHREKYAIFLKKTIKKARACDLCPIFTTYESELFSKNRKNYETFHSFTDGCRPLLLGQPVNGFGPADASRTDGPTGTRRQTGQRIDLLHPS